MCAFPRGLVYICDVQCLFALSNLFNNNIRRVYIFFFFGKFHSDHASFYSTMRRNRGRNVSLNNIPKVSKLAGANLLTGDVIVVIIVCIFGLLNIIMRMYSTAEIPNYNKQTISTKFHFLFRILFE